MDRTEIIAARIEERLKFLGIKARAACLRAGLRVDAIRSIRAGHRPKAETLAALADVLQVTPNYLLGAGAVIGSTRDANAHRLISVPVKGSVQAGVWKLAVEWPHDEWFDVVLPRDRRFSGARRFGLQVCGASMDRIYPEASVVVVVPFEQIGRGPMTGERVVVVRRCQRTSEYEATLKEYEKDKAGRHLLWPRSTDPDFQQPFILPPGHLPIASNPMQGADGNEHDLTVLALVITSIKDEPTDNM